MSRMFGARWRSHARASRSMGVAPGSAPRHRSVRTEDWSGVNPPRGKNGTYAIPWRARSSMMASSWRWARLWIVLDADDGGDASARASANWAAVTLLRPTIADQAFAPQVGKDGHLLGYGSFRGAVDCTHGTVVDDFEWVSRPRLVRLSWTPAVRSWEEMAGCPGLVGRATGRRAW